VNSLTLGEIIRLNTDFENAPDNVFFSTMHCAGVENYQCSPRKEQSVTDKNSDNAEAKATFSSNSMMLYVLAALLAVLTLVFTVILVVFWRRQRKPSKAKQQNTEMNCIQNMTFNEQATNTNGIKTV